MNLVSSSAGVVDVCACDCDCGYGSGSVCDVCAWVWPDTPRAAGVVVAAIAAAVAAADEEAEHEACARCSLHGKDPLDRSSMISSSPSSATHHPPAKLIIKCTRISHLEFHSAMTIKNTVEPP